MAKPKLRFPEFTEDWGKSKFGNEIIEQKERTSDKIKYPLYSLTIEEGVIPKSERYEREFLIKKEEDMYKIVPPNAFVYNPMNLRFGALKVNHQKFPVSVSGYYNIFTLYDTEALAFWENYLVTDKMLNYYFSIATGTLVEKLRVHFSQFIEIKKPLPNKDERKKISDFLSKYDEKISNQETVVSDYIEMKKGLIQKIFSQEVRFKADDGSEYPKWMEYRIGDVFSERNEKNSIDEILLSVTIDEGVKRRDEMKGKNNASEDKSNYKRVCINDMVYNTMRMWQGANGISSYNGIVSPAYTVLKPKIEINCNFFSYLFKTKKLIFQFYRNSQGLTSDTWNLKYPHISTIKILVPCLKEQQRIADCLSAMDRKIEAEKKILEDWKELKKALLQQMFV
jgi:type I restriction enzyme S subunit